MLAGHSNTTGKVLHIVGICGIGMSGIAQIFKAQGWTVQGSDDGPGGSTRQLLESEGILVSSDLHLIEKADLVAHSNAISTSHGQLQHAELLGKKIIKRWEALKMLLEGKNVIVISGCHGKTSATVMVGEIFTAAGMNPTIICGGIMKRFSSNVRVGSPDLYIVEGDESDDTFFSIPASTAVVTNVRADHLDFHGSLQKLQGKFAQFVAQAEHSIAPRLPCLSQSECLFYDVDPSTGRQRFKDVLQSGMQTKFTYCGSQEAQFVLNAIGEFNVKNAMCAIECALIHGIKLDVIQSALSSYQGVERRMSFKGIIGHGNRVYDDYAHHPEEIVATARAAQAIKDTVVVVQPHRYSRVENLYSDYCDLWKSVTRIIFLEIFGAGEQKRSLTSQGIVDESRKRGATNVSFAANMKELMQQIIEINLKDGLIIFMGAGDTGRIAVDLVESCEKEKVGVNH